MRREAVLAVLGLVAVFVASAVPASAHTQFTITGYAIDGTNVYDVSVSRTFDAGPDCIEEVRGPEGEVGCLRWRINWIRPFGGDPIVDGHLFIGEDNWVPPDVNAGHVGEFHGASLLPTVDFVLDGYQTSEFVTVTGHYEQYDLVLSFLPAVL